MGSLVRNNLKEKRILGVLTVCLALILLVGCASNESAKFKEAGCVAAESKGLNEAAVQFNLAAENGDPEAVAAAIAAQQIWGMLMTAGDIDLDQLESNKEYITDLASEVASYCGAGYDIR
jgi:hypothetical protein